MPQVVNKKAIELALKTALALDCQVVSLTERLLAFVVELRPSHMCAEFPLDI